MTVDLKKLYRKELPPPGQQPRVIFCIETLGPGGAERVLSILANALTERGYEVVIALADSADLESCIYDFSERVAMVKLSIPAMANGWRSLRGLRRQFLRWEGDVYIGFLAGMNMRVAQALLFSGKPVIVSERSDMSQYFSGLNWRGRQLLKYSFRHVSAFVAQTQAMRKHLLASPWSIPDKTIHVIPNPVRPFSPQNPGPISAGKKIIAVGRLFDRRKGFDLLLRAFARVADELPEWNLVIFGARGDDQTLLHLRHELHLDARVAFPGITTDIYAELSVADIFVLSSRTEGFPNVLLEAMAAGKAVIATDCKYGPNEIVQNGENGILIAVDDIHALAASISALANDEPLRRRLGRAAAMVTERFSQEKITTTWCRLIHSVVARRCTGGASQ